MKKRNRKIVFGLLLLAALTPTKSLLVCAQDPVVKSESTTPPKREVIQLRPDDVTTIVAMHGTLSDNAKGEFVATGFETPQDEWFRDLAWKNLVSDILNSWSFNERRLINPKVAKAMHNNHISGKKNSSKEIWKWIHLEMWFKEFIDNPKST